jgi:hypothetical protein
MVETQNTFLSASLLIKKQSSGTLIMSHFFLSFYLRPSLYYLLSIYCKVKKAIRNCEIKRQTGELRGIDKLFLSLYCIK